MKRFGRHDELTNLAAFLLSDMSQYINGECVVIDGALWLRGAGEFNDLLHSPTAPGKPWNPPAPKNPDRFHSIRPCQPRHLRVGHPFVAPPDFVPLLLTSPVLQSRRSMFCTLRPAAAVLITTLLLSPFAPARQSQPQAPASNTKPKSLIWDPPKFDAKLRSAANSSPCDLDKVLAQAADRATELIDNLQNFTAREQLDFRTYGPGGFGDNRGGGSAAFDYTARSPSEAQVLL